MTRNEAISQAVLLAMKSGEIHVISRLYEDCWTVCRYQEHRGGGCDVRWALPRGEVVRLS